MRAHLLSALAITAASAAITAPAAAQYVVSAYDGPADAPYVDELVVTGPVNRDGPARLSQAISIRDLDLTTREGQAVLKWRIRDTARELCRALGESSAASPIAPSCVDQAIRDARPQVRFATNQAYARNAYARQDLIDPYARVPY